MDGGGAKTAGRRAGRKTSGQEEQAEEDADKDGEKGDGGETPAQEEAQYVPSHVIT